ncbi:M20/M25/M40 family metallo-hydrolase [Opitutia bacterium ISCC 51]|nr:M20/M25/M40 family metallo-hydrolase [Opitutae bacterium ISCC 51]QXD29944.1 M20/M25/M40 family metallo-hydrolase [Opitutae bacterium ISCC 52]
MDNKSPLTGIESDIVAAIDRNRDEALSFLRRVIDTNSGTMNFEGVLQVGDMFSEVFDSLGLQTRWYDKSQVNRSGHLFAETLGDKGKRLLLIGHLDTVYPSDSPFQKMEQKEDGRWRAPGGEDMKGGDVIIVYALKALSELRLLSDAQIIVAFTGDEENPGSPLEETRKELVEAAKRSDIALGFEGAGDGSKAVVSRRGASFWKLEVQGKRAHSSTIFSEDVGAGAVFELSRILNAFYEELSGEEYLTLNPGLIAGGSDIETDEAEGFSKAYGKFNVVAETAVASGGLRYVSEAQLKSAREQMREIVSRHLPHTSATITFSDGYPAMAPTEGNRGLLDQMNQVSLDLGLPTQDLYNPLERGAADISFIADYVDALDGLGAMGGGAHSLDEFIDLNTFGDQIKRAALLIYRLIQS